MRVHPASRAIAIEPRADRRERIARNAAALGVPGLRGRGRRRAAGAGRAATPRRGLHRRRRHGRRRRGRLLDALGPGGRLVANAVTIEGQAVLADWRQRLGGTLTRIGVERADGLGTFTTWRPALPVVQWSMHKKESP